MREEIISQTNALHHSLSPFFAFSILTFLSLSLSFSLSLSPPLFSRLDPVALKPKPHNGRKLKFTDADKLFDAVLTGDAAEVEGLLQQGVDPNVRDADGLTPLHK